jgi:hypothetical protein
MTPFGIRALESSKSPMVYTTNPRFWCGHAPVFFSLKYLSWGRSAICSILRMA